MYSVAKLVNNLIDKYQVSEKLLDRALTILSGEDDYYECEVSTFDETENVADLVLSKEQWKERLKKILDE